MKLAGRKVLVVGLARTGIAVARFLLEQKAEVCCTDLSPIEKLNGTVNSLLAPHCRLVLGEHNRDDFIGADLIIVSPGVPLTIAPLEEARKAGVEIIGEEELAFRFINCPIIAVTGTNGKTTTVSLIDAMLEKAGIPHWVGGNIGRPLIDLLLTSSSNGEEKAPEVVVVELSSFQLETIVSFHPWIAVWTNFSYDHLDRYPDMEAYAEAKVRIFMNQTAHDYAIVPARDGWLNPRMSRLDARILRFGYLADPDVELRFEEGCIRYRKGEGEGEECYETGRVQLPGKHNIENIMAALAVARICGASPDAVQEVMENFAGLEHRVEYAGECRDVRFYNDSKATTVDSVVQALESFERPILLLAGGKDKGGPYNALREPIQHHVRRLFLYGEAAARLEEELAGTVESERATDLEAAFQSAWNISSPGDVILLSPACSSFDMFKDYEERGKRFKALVEKCIREE